MSLISETYLQDIRVNYPNMFDAKEWRGPERGLLRSVEAMNSSPMSLMTSEVKSKLDQSQGRSVEIPVVNKGAITLKTTRSCSIDAYDHTSALMSVTYATVVADFHMVRAQHAKNHVSYLEDLRKKLQLVREAFEGSVEAACLAQLEADKDQFYGSPFVVGGSAIFGLSGNAMQVAVSDQERFFNYTDAIMDRDDFGSGSHYIIGSTELNPSVDFYRNQGSSNDENLSFQYSNKSFDFTNAIPNAGTNLATGFIIPDGSLAIHYRNAIESRGNYTTTRGTEWGESDILGMGRNIGYQFFSECSDQSALNDTGLEHLTATMVEKWSWSFDYAILSPYNSSPTTRAGGVKKFEFLS